MSAMLSCPDSPQLLQNHGKLTFNASAPVKAVSANFSDVRSALCVLQNRPFVQFAFPHIL